MLEKLNSAIVKLQGFALSQEQATNIEIIYNTCLELGIKRKRHISYIFATIFHEGARKETINGKTIFRRVVSVEEIGKGKGKPYGSKIKYSKINITQILINFILGGDLFKLHGMKFMKSLENY
jgi:hypothetical protein